MSDIAGHPLLHLLEAETASLLQQDRADAEEAIQQEAAETQAAANQSAAEAAAKVAVDADAIEGMDPPAADVLGIDVTGLGEKRGLLVRFAAWIASLEQRLDQITAGRAVFLGLLGVPVVKEKALADLVASDKSRLMAWMQSGASLTRPTIPRARTPARERVKAGMADAKKRGVHTGRKHTLRPHQRSEAARLHKEGESLGRIAALFGCGWTVVYRAIHGDAA